MSPNNPRNNKVNAGMNDNYKSNNFGWHIHQDWDGYKYVYFLTAIIDYLIKNRLMARLLDNFLFVTGIAITTPQNSWLKNMENRIR